MPELTITDEMINHFAKRTQKHIRLVHKYLNKILDAKIPGIDNEILDEEKIIHDSSKFEDPEVTPYVLLTWRYLQQTKDNDFEYPQHIQDKITEATEHHVKSNKHHPEYWSEQDIPMINPNDRDKPPEVKVRCEKMPISYIACMVADWLAMAEEKGTDPFEWAKKNIGIRWVFSDEQKSMIYEMLDLWRD